MQESKQTHVPSLVHVIRFFCYVFVLCFGKICIKKSPNIGPKKDYNLTRLYE